MQTTATLHRHQVFRLPASAGGRPVALRVLCYFSLLLLPAGGAAAPPDQDRSVESSGLKLVTPPAQLAIDRGLAWLAARQQENGAFGSGGTYRQNVAITGLAGMAFLSAGHSPGRGRYGPIVSRALDYILARCQPSGFIVDEDTRAHGPMYGHGFATLFLAEVYGMSPRTDIRDKLTRAVRLIVSTQNSEGGWRYQPVPREADISVTVCQVMALRAARNCGIHVPRETIDRSVEYARRCQNPDGGFRYQLAPRGDSVFPRSAAGIVALYSAGIYEGQDLERGLDYLLRHLPQGEFFRHEPNYFYGHYYAVQAMWHAGGEKWYRWYPAVRDQLVRRQQPAGAWPDTNICPEYGTAMACLVLQMPNNYLPIFQR